MAAGGSLHALLLTFLAALLALGSAHRWLPRPAAFRSGSAAGVAPPALESVGLRAGLLAGALVAAVALAGRPVALWWVAVLLLAAAAFRWVVRSDPVRDSAQEGRGREAVLWALAVGCAALALAAHRYDLDDAFYVNLAVAVVDAPAAPLLAGDTLHGVSGLPIHLPVYRVHSYELWNAALSWLFGIEAIASFHWVSATLAAALVPLCFARFLRRLLPGTWPWATAAVIWVLLVSADTHRAYGNFAMVRIWQGKSIYLFVFLPLVYAYALEFAERPGARVWLRLCAAQIAAVGCSASALWAAPAAAGAALACAVMPSRAGLRVLAVGALASLYVLLAGWQVRTHLAEDSGAQAILESGPASTAQEAAQAEAHRPGAQLAIAFDAVLGKSRLRMASLAAVLAAWIVCVPGPARRFAIIVPLATLLVLLDPYATRWLTENVTGPYYWRVLWALPVPVLLALLLTAPLALERVRTGLGRSVTLAAFALFAVLVPTRGSLSETNDVRLGWPELKVEPENHAWARALTERVPPGAHVVAPLPIAAWLGTFHDRAFPLVVRSHYLTPYAAQLGDDEILYRTLMMRYVVGEARNPNAPELFRAGLQRFEVRGVCLRDFPDAPRARRILREAGFERVLRGGNQEIWVRS